MVLGSAWVVLRINNLVIIIFIAVISIIVAIIVAVIIIVTVVIIMLSRPASVVATVQLLDILDHESTENLLGLSKIKRDPGPLCVVVDDLVVVEPINILRRLQSLWSVKLLVMVMRMVMTTTMMTTIMVTLEPAKVVENLWGYFF